MNVFDPAGPQASSIATLMWWFFGICAVVYVLVIGALFWTLARRRRAADDSAAASRSMGVAVTGAVGLTVVTLIALIVADSVAGRGLTAPSGPGAITVDVIGHQWWWEFQYHDVSPNEIVNAPNELHLPVGVPVVIRAMSRDVIHSFWVPRLHGKRDLIPGQITQTWIQADEPGVYRGQCAEFCGYQHAHMALLVVAEPMDRFLAWIQEQRKGAPQPATPEARRGHDVFMAASCALCHTIRGTPAGSRVGPDLTHVASRRTIAAGTLPNTAEHRAQWVADSQSVKPGNRMPANPVSRDDLPAVLAYLETLR
jgi:cytochrome c oxidase subunit 2